MWQGSRRQKNWEHKGIVFYLWWSRRRGSCCYEWRLVSAFLEIVIRVGISPFNIWAICLNLLFTPLHFQEEPQWITLSGYKKGNQKKCQMSLWLFHVIVLLFRQEVGLHPTHRVDRGDSCLQSLFIRRDCPFRRTTGLFSFLLNKVLFSDLRSANLTHPRGFSEDSIDEKQRFRVPCLVKFCLISILIQI